jgi:hypothetical protein
MPLLMCTPPESPKLPQNSSGSPTLAGSPKRFGFFMSRRVPNLGTSSPSCQRMRGVSVPAPFKRSTVSPKMSEKDSFRAPDCV